MENSPVLVSLQAQHSRAEFHPLKTIQPLCGQEFRIYWKITTWRKHSSRATFVNICWHLEPSQSSSQFMQSRQKLIISLTIIFSGSQVMTVHEQHRNKVLNYLWRLKHLNKNAGPSCVPADSWIRSRERKLGLGSASGKSQDRGYDPIFFCSSALGFELCFIFRTSRFTRQASGDLHSISSSSTNLIQL